MISISPFPHLQPLATTLLLSVLYEFDFFSFTPHFLSISRNLNKSCISRSHFFGICILINTDLRKIGFTTIIPGYLHVYTKMST